MNWKIVIEQILPDHPQLGTGKEYWGFEIFLGSENKGVGSADDIETCASMAREMIQDTIAGTFHGG